MASIIRPQAIRRAATAASNLRCASKSNPITSSILKSTASEAHKSTILKASCIGANRTAFHTSARRDILPPLPQRLTGTANEAAVVPPPDSNHGVNHWILERGVSVLLIPITIAPFVGGSLNPTLDAVFCGLLVVHSHVGFQSAITDYFPGKRVPKTRKAMEWTLLGSSALVAWALWEFETNDVGLTEGVKRIWKAGQ